MTRTRSAIAAAVLAGCCYAVGQQASPDAPKSLNVTVDTQKTADPVSKYVFGSFIEHIGPLIYRSMWAELINDRKFYFPISSTDPEAPQPQSGYPMRQPLHKWRPVGPDAAVAMDTNQPFVGDHSPRISLDSSTPHGIRQAGFALVNELPHLLRQIEVYPGSHVTRLAIQFNGVDLCAYERADWRELGRVRPRGGALGYSGGANEDADAAHCSPVEAIARGIGSASRIDRYKRMALPRRTECQEDNEQQHHSERPRADGL
jgi:hypothetical protein